MAILDRRDAILYLMIGRLPLVFTPQPEGGFTVTSPTLPELITEGDTFEQATINARDALAAVVELYEEEGRSIPIDAKPPADGMIVWTDELDVALRGSKSEAAPPFKLPPDDDALKDEVEAAVLGALELYGKEAPEID
jgi:antitoxin HicB